MWLKAYLDAKSVNLPQLAKMSSTLILDYGIFSIKSSVQNALQSLADKIVWNVIGRNNIPRTLWLSPLTLIGQRK